VVVIEVALLLEKQSQHTVCSREDLYILSHTSMTVDHLLNPHKQAPWNLLMRLGNTVFFETI